MAIRGLVPLRLSCGHNLMLYNDTPDGTEVRCVVCATTVRVEREAGVVAQNG